MFLQHRLLSETNFTNRALAEILFFVHQSHVNILSFLRFKFSIAEQASDFFVHLDFIDMTL